MNMLDIHNQALEDINEAHHTFLLSYRRDRKVVFGIVEGKDDPMFYRGVIERFLPDDWAVELIPAGNKNKVLEFVDKLDWNAYSRNQVVGFVDRDLSQFLHPPITYYENLYITDGYSIENSIVTPDVFYRLMVETYNVVDCSEYERQNLISIFEEDATVFRQALVPIMAQILAWRRSGAKANIDNLALAPMFEFREGRLCVVDAFADRHPRVSQISKCAGAPHAASDEIDELSAEISAAENSEHLTRGKYLLWYLVNAVSNIHQNISLFVSAYEKPPKVKLPTGVANVMIVAAPRARIPATLRSFIDRTFLTYVKDVTS